MENDPIGAAIREAFGAYVSERRIQEFVAALRRRGYVIARQEDINSSVPPR